MIKLLLLLIVEPVLKILVDGVGLRPFVSRPIQNNVNMLSLRRDLYFQFEKMGYKYDF